MTSSHVIASRLVPVRSQSLGFRVFIVEWLIHYYSSENADPVVKPLLSRR